MYIKQVLILQNKMTDLSFHKVMFDLKSKRVNSLDGLSSCAKSNSTINVCIFVETT